MSDRTFEHDEEGLKAAVHGALLARDHAMPAPRLARVWPGDVSTRSSKIFQQPAFAALTALVVLASVSWVFFGRRGEDPVPPADLQAATELARQLSSPDYWRVPTDELLAFSASPLSADLPSAEGFHVSLEESLL